MIILCDVMRDVTIAVMLVTASVCNSTVPNQAVTPTHCSPTMDRIESLGNTLSNLTMYDIKSMYNQVRISSCETPTRVIGWAEGVVLMHPDANIIGKERGIQCE